MVPILEDSSDFIMINKKEKNYKKLSLVAQNEEDLVVISTLCQDSIIKVANIKWAKKSKRFYLLINRFCWELNELSKKKSSNMLRINSIMSFNSVLSVKSAGIQQNNNSDITSLLTINYNFFNFEKQAIDLIFSGNSQITLNIECIDVFLKDISEPFEGTTSKQPKH